jgi:[protein-PII] uridylyltransferase
LDFIEQIMAHRPNITRKLKDLRDHFVQECRADVSGLLAARTYSSNLQDALCNAFAEHSAPREGWAIVAVGGFGRGELSFASDLDLLFLYKKRLPPFLSELVHDLVYGLWDNAFEVGHATASVSMVHNMVQNDFSILTNYLEARLVAGDVEFFNDWKRSFLKLYGNPSRRRRFLQNLIAYRETRLHQYGESPYLLEPNVKDGVGGLRDLHTIRWAGVVYLQDPSLEAMLKNDWLTDAEKLWIEQSYDFLWRVRLQLHQLSGRRQDRLLFPEQEQIALRMGFMEGTEGSAVEAFMRLYYRYTSRVRRTTSFFLERLEESQRGFRFHLRRRILPGPFLLEGKHLHFMEPEWVGKDPLLLMRFFWQVARSKAHFHHNAGKIIRENLGGFGERERRNPQAINQFFDILLDREYSFHVLKTMLETAFLQVFIPEFSAVRYRVQNDVYHLYTVDEHLLRTVHELHLIEADQVNGEEPLKSAAVLISQEERRILYLAALLHDIGKGRGKNHSMHGATMAGEIAVRMGLDDGQRNLLCFLIEHHLILTEIALKRDLMDEKPIAQCAVIIKDRRRLLLLYMLTVADSRATGTAAWNTWKASLLRELFFKVDRLLGRADLEPEDIEARTAQTQRKVLALFPDPAESEKLSEWMERLPFRYLLSQHPQEILKHYEMEKELARRSVCFKAEPLEGEMWQTTVVTRDRPGLFALITGVLWARGLNILSADIYTREPGVACDILRVERIPDPLHREELWVKVESDLVRALADSSYLDEILENRRRPSVLEAKCHPRKDDKVLIDEEASDFYTLIEVYTWDRPGVLHTITSALFELDINIQLAKISTPGAQVVDIFYVTDLSGEKLISYDKHEQVREKLLGLLSVVC